MINKNGQFLWKNQYYNQEELQKREFEKQQQARSLLTRQDSTVSLDKKKLMGKRRSTTFKGDGLMANLSKNLLKKTLAHKMAENNADTTVSR